MCSKLLATVTALSHNLQAFIVPNTRARKSNCDCNHTLVEQDPMLVWGCPLSVVAMLVGSLVEALQLWHRAVRTQTFNVIATALLPWKWDRQAAADDLRDHRGP